MIFPHAKEKPTINDLLDLNLTDQKLKEILSTLHEYDGFKKPVIIIYENGEVAYSTEVP